MAGSKQICGLCGFAFFDNRDVLRCRRFPPTVNDSLPGGLDKWPIVEDSDWCGEWITNAQPKIPHRGEVDTTPDVTDTAIETRNVRIVT